MKFVGLIPVDFYAVIYQLHHYIWQTKIISEAFEYKYTATEEKSLQNISEGHQINDIDRRRRRRDGLNDPKC